MSVTREQITRIARLSRLKVDAHQAEFYAGQLSSILELVEQMNRIDTQGVKPMSHPQETALRLRDDQAEDQASADARRAEYQRIAPAVRHRLYLTPRVIDPA